jgi:hypothetical protein
MPMPAVLNNTPCTACGGRHTLCFPRAEALDAWRSYEYDCPTVEQTVELPLSYGGKKPSNERVRGSVTLRQVT